MHLPRPRGSTPPRVREQLYQHQAAAGGGQLTRPALVREVVAGVRDLKTQPAAARLPGHLGEQQRVGVGVHQDVGDRLGDEQHRGVHLLGRAPVVQQLAQVPAGLRDPLGLVLRHRQRRAPHRGPGGRRVAPAAVRPGPAQQQHRDVVLASVGPRAGRVVRGRPQHPLHQRVGQRLRVAPVVLPRGAPGKRWGADLGVPGTLDGSGPRARLPPERQLRHSSPHHEGR